MEATPPKGGGTAVVVLLIDIDAAGLVSAAEVLQSGGEAFDQAALNAARKFIFKPAEIDGQPAAVRIHYRYTFTETIQEAPKVATATLSGTVQNGDKQPIPEARIVLNNTQSTSTNTAGTFRFDDLKEGVYTLSIEAEGYSALRATKQLISGKNYAIIYTLSTLSEHVDEELVLRAPRIIAPQASVGIQSQEASKIPGTQGDTLKVVQSLPGVARASSGSGALVVWGAAPEDTRVLVDGVEIPSLYHIGGVRSTINSALVDSINLVPGAFGPAYGRGIGGLVLVETKALDPKNITGYLAADLYDASGMLSVPVYAKTRAAVSGRLGYLDRVLPQFIDSDVQQLFPVPRYRDAQLKLEQTLRKDESIGITLLYADDVLERAANGENELQTASYFALLVPYTRIFSGGASTRITPHFVQSQDAVEATFGATPTERSRTSKRFGIRAEYREALSSPLTLVLGVDALGEISEIAQTGTLGRPPREGDVSVFGQPPGDDIATDRFETSIFNVGIHASAALQLGDFTLVPGLRLDTFALSGDRSAPPIGETPRVGFLRMENAFSPRLSVRWNASENIALNASTGLYNQPPRAHELSAVFGNPTLSLSEALHVVSGAEIELYNSVTLELTGFYETFSNLVARNISPTPPLAEALTQDGEGRSFGGQLLIRRTLTGGLSGWISYTLSRSERIDFAGGPVRLFDFDQTHVLSIVSSYTWNNWTFGGRARYTTGFPRTPVVDAFFDTKNDRFQPIFGAQNSTRLPNFFQLDLRTEYLFDLGSGELSIYADVQNVSNHENSEEILYNYDFTRKNFIQGLPILAIVGGKYTF